MLGATHGVPERTGWVEATKRGTGRSVPNSSQKSAVALAGKLRERARIAMPSSCSPTATAPASADDLLITGPVRKRRGTSWVNMLWVKALRLIAFGGRPEIIHILRHFLWKTSPASGRNPLSGKKLRGALVHKTLHARHRLFDVFDSGRVRAAYESFAARAKRAARHHRHALLLQQLHREFF